MGMLEDESSVEYTWGVRERRAAPLWIIEHAAGAGHMLVLQSSTSM